MSFPPAFTPSRSDVEGYRRWRSLGKQLNHRLVQTIPRKSIYAVGDAIGILRKGVLVFETKDVCDVLTDLCLYDWPPEGRSCVQGYAESHNVGPATGEGELLQCFLRAEYRILVPRACSRGAGVYFVDAFSEEQFFVMDIGLSQGPLRPEMAFATRIIPLRRYWMTGGVALPMTSEAREVTYRRLAAQGVLVGEAVTDRRRMALTTVRTCLKAGAVHQVAFEDPPRRVQQG